MIHVPWVGGLFERIQNAALPTKERLLADFPYDDIRSALAIFDRRLVRKAFGILPCPRTRQFMLRGVKQVATALGCNPGVAVLQYNDVIVYMLRQFSPGLPLAALTNPQAWARLLDDKFWDAACPGRLVGASHVLRKLIRFYISIEDGECSVERDFGTVRDLLTEHRTGDEDFMDDVVIAKLLGPKTADGFDDGAAGGSSSRDELTPFSRKCACLWRQLYGKRKGHYNPHATRAAKNKAASKRGPLRRATVGVLVAARFAVQCKRARVARAVAELHPGAGTVRSTRWSDKMKKFHQRSVTNIPGATQVRAAPGARFMKPPGVVLNATRGARKAPAAPSPHRKVAVLAASGAIEDLRVETGTHRCAEADLVVVEDLAILHDVASLAADVDMAVSFLYIVAFGLDVVTRSQLAAASYVPSRLLPSQYLRHVRVCETKATFRVEERLDVEFPSVRAALRRIARAPTSKIAVAAVGAPASEGVSLATLRDVVNWALSARRVLNELGPKVLSVDGSRLRT